MQVCPAGQMGQNRIILTSGLIAGMGHKVVTWGFFMVEEGCC